VAGGAFAPPHRLALLEPLPSRSSTTHRLSLSPSTHLGDTKHSYTQTDEGPPRKMPMNMDLGFQEKAAMEIPGARVGT
jgi:hypothetical protein